jgi:DNA-binding transcriptional regulator YbjK
MGTTRNRALESAVELVGEQGIRALTHARIDARAGLPKGSTSNWFRTRAALLGGLILFIAESERAESQSIATVRVTTPTQLVDLLSDLVRMQTTERAARTRVRFALFLEAAHDPDLLAPLLAQRAAFVDWSAAMLRDVGAQHPEEAARTLLACGNGLVFHLLTVDPDAEVRSTLERAVRACLA